MCKMYARYGVWVFRVILQINITFEIFTLAANNMSEVIIVHALLPLYHFITLLSARTFI